MTFLDCLSRATRRPPLVALFAALLVGATPSPARNLQADTVDGELLALADWVNHVNNQPEPKRVWTYDDPLWHYKEKFNVFHLREWVADCTVVRAALQELRLYQTEGSVKSVYRTTDEEIVLKHLETIQSYWD